MQCYMVGGAVRDLLMGIQPKDVDMAFSGTIESFLQLFPHAQKVGKSISVWIVNNQEFMPLHQGCISQDLQHRDLTINAVALDAHGILYTHPLALFDLKNKILRPASPTAFQNDPTRIFRLARFAATFANFTIHKEAILQALAVTHQQAHVHLPAERVGRELMKALQAPKPSRFMQIITKTQSQDPWFTECYALAPDIRQHWFTLMDTVKQPCAPPAIWAQGKETTHLLALIRWMFLGYSMGNTEKKQLEAHAVYSLGQRLCLPLFYTKAAYCMAQTFKAAHAIEKLPIPQQVSLLLQIHKAGITWPYWKAMSHICASHKEKYALQALQCILAVHLPTPWQNLGKCSGEKLQELQCQALENFIQEQK